MMMCFRWVRQRSCRCGDTHPTHHRTMLAVWVHAVLVQHGCTAGGRMGVRMCVGVVANILSYRAARFTWQG